MFQNIDNDTNQNKTIHIMNLSFCLVFFILLNFTSALKCYKCEEKNPDADLSNGFCSRLYNKNSWEIVECSGSCFSGSKAHPSLQGHRVGQRFLNPTYCIVTSRSTCCYSGDQKFCFL